MSRTVRSWLSLTLAVALVTAGCSKDDGDAEAFCTEAIKAENTAAVFETYDPSDTARTADQFDEALSSYEELRELAPGEIRDELDVLIDFTRDFRDQVRELDDDDPAGATGVALKLRDRFEAVEKATASLKRFVGDGCGQEN